jgi:small conductance mechanosensitive channel
VTDGTSLQPIVEWVARNWLAILLVSVGLLLVFRYARPLVRRIARRLLVPRASGADAELHAEEAEKRVATIEDLFVKLIRFAVVLTLVLFGLTLLDLLPVLAGLTVIGAAITLAGQSIVLDYLMGILILVEGQYYRDDWIAVGGLEGTVEEVGLRRTVIRDSTGTVHSISNGEIRTSSNMTRIYAAVLVDVIVDQATDIDRAASVIDETGKAMADDPAWRDRLLEPPRFTRITDIGDMGITLRVTGRVRAADRWSAPGELRRRLLRAFADNGIQLTRRDRLVAPPRVASDAES